MASKSLGKLVWSNCLAVPRNPTRLRKRMAVQKWASKGKLQRVKIWWKLSGDGSNLFNSVGPQIWHDLAIGSVLTVYVLVSFLMALSENRVLENPMVDHHVLCCQTHPYDSLHYGMDGHVLGFWLKPLFRQSHLKTKNKVIQRHGWLSSAALRRRRLLFEWDSDHVTKTLISDK